MAVCGHAVRMRLLVVEDDDAIAVPLVQGLERAGYSGWQRHRSAPPHQGAIDAQLDARDVASGSGFRQTKVVKPEDLFDHNSFTDFFR